MHLCGERGALEASSLLLYARVTCFRVKMYGGAVFLCSSARYPPFADFPVTIPAPRLPRLLPSLPPSLLPFHSRPVPPLPIPPLPFPPSTCSLPLRPLSPLFATASLCLCVRGRVLMSAAIPGAGGRSDCAGRGADPRAGRADQGRV